MTQQELRNAQKDIYNGGKCIASAGMRLSGSKYAGDFEKLWQALSQLNDRLINDIREGR